MHGIGGVGGADIDVDQHALAAAGHQRVSRRHMACGILMRTAHDLWHRFAALAAVRHFLDDRRVIGAEITKQIFDADLFEALEQIIRGREGADVASARD